MMSRSTKSFLLAGSFLLGLAMHAFAAIAASGATWNPADFASESTLEFFTINEAGEAHWATVWFVLVDGDVYVRLGERAQRRIEENIHQPVVKVRVAGREFDHVVVERVLGRNDEIAEAMADKYWTALFMPYMPERYTARLVAGAPE